MFENLTLVIIFIVIFWLSAYGFYLFTSRQQENIVDDLERLNKKLDEVEKHD
jgi:Na+/melibiose symporter-like transporter